MGKYLEATDIKRNHPLRLTIRAVRREIVDGRPRLVVYFKNNAKGLLLTKEMADELTRQLGHHPMVDEFFSGEGLLH
jgi:hypothetical protein